MSIHLEAEKSDISENILLPGDPLRAKYIAENFFTEMKCINTTRGMLGYTGLYKGNKVTVIGSGMGQASLSIYVNELIREYNAKKIIRVGTCGALKDNVKIKDIVLAQSASTDSNHNKITFNNLDYAACCSFNLLNKAYNHAKKDNTKVHVGNILSTDSFYPFNDEDVFWKTWANFGVLAVEMESNALYTLCAKYNIEGLSILTVSDSLVTGEQTSKEERQNTFSSMVSLALEVITDQE